jgi:hypothetical protein
LPTGNYKVVNGQIVPEKKKEQNNKWRKKLYRD